MVLNLYSCARRGVDIICALRAFNEAILVDERVRCGGRCGFGEGRHGCVVCGCVWADRGAPRVGVSRSACFVCCGGVLLSHNLSVAVPLALPGLASRFGMVLGVSPVL